ncbi:SUKH-4 immunity protein-domain-containing protein [Aspergillus sergii]|uniref:SUKH-4 immunity protein-domain-containing protein n=1 Tax=Aspergillus sergii TaxID=1034303 RepID=A0A5N6WUJ9_9EURO|nr:SUKH-4 immunity protein-domain-containing protein [Aspergillus sergii]
MPGFLSLPAELIFQVYCSLDTIGDAYFLSQTCQQTYSIFRRPQSQPRIFEAIIDNIIHDAAPTKAWLESQFGPGSLWQPTEAELPVDLTDKETIEFLLDVGFPSVNLPRMGFNSTDLRKSADKGQTLDGYTADELFDIFYHDEDEGYPPALSFRFGERHHKLVLLNNKNGTIYVYDPENWFSYRGVIAYGLDNLAVLLGMVVAVTKGLRNASPDISRKELERRIEVLQGPLDILREKLRDYDFSAHYYSEFWDELFAKLMHDRRFVELDGGCI